MTLYTSDKKADQLIFIYLLASVVCASFGAVYERFSHEVYAYSMIYAFLFPLAAGALPLAAIRVVSPEREAASFFPVEYHCGIATLTAGSIVCGILEIYGTTNSLTRWYWIVGIGLCAVGLKPKGIKKQLL